MNKKISFPIAIIIIIICAVLAGIITWQYRFIPEIEMPPFIPAEKSPEEMETADLSRDEVLRDWQTYKNEEYGFEFRYPPEWGDITSTRVEDVTIGWYGVTYFSFEKEDDVYFSIINIKDWPDGIYEQGYEGVDLLKIDMNKQKQYIKEASEEDGCYESVSSQYNKVFKFQGLEDCQVIFLTKEIKAQLDYPYFLPLFGLSKQYTFYKENRRFIFDLRFSEFAQILRERSGPERQYAIPLYEQEFIEKFKNLLKQKIAESPYTSPATVGLSESFDKILSTFRFLE